MGLGECRRLQYSQIQDRNQRETQTGGKPSEEMNELMIGVFAVCLLRSVLPSAGVCESVCVCVRECVCERVCV